MRSMAIVGTGLMGASVGLAAKKAFPELHIGGVDSNPEAVEEARALGAVDMALPLREVAGVDFVCLAMPMRYLAEVLKSLGPVLSQGVLWMEIGSSKQNVLAEVKACLGELPARFVPCHPIAGGEQAGPGAARADVFEGSKVILTPHECQAPPAREEVRAFWQALGAQVVEMAAREHDEILAFTSHLPHLLAFGLAFALEEASPHVHAGMGPGFFSFMRLAKGNPSLWEDICMANREALLVALRRYQSTLSCIEAALEEGPGGQALLQLLEQAHQRRQTW